MTVRLIPGLTPRAALTTLIILAFAAAEGPAAHESSAGPSNTVRQQRLLVLTKVNAEFFGRSNFPGSVLAARFRDGAVLSSAQGVSDRETRRPMQVDDRMLAGSVGKTFFAALALQLVGEGLIDLDRPISHYLRNEAWISRLAGADQVTVRMLMNHTSGYGDYDEAFTQDLVRNPLRQRESIDMISSILDRPLAGTPGSLMRYSDLNYILLAQLTERVTQRTAYSQIERRFIGPLHLLHTTPAVSPRIEGLVPGYAGQQPYGPDKMVVAGQLALNPQFEWGGGGFASTAGDLAQWFGALCGGTVIPRHLWPEMTRGVDAPANGPRSHYGLGLHIDETPAGVAYGHGGYFPGYFTFVRCFPEQSVSIAMMVNSSNRADFDGKISDVLDRAAASLMEAGLIP